MIKYIEITNFKKTTGTFEFNENGLTAIVGNNRSGKTTILEAIEFALTGSVGVSNKNVDVFNGFCEKGEKQMKVKLGLVDGEIIRSITQETSKDGFKYTGDVMYKGVLGNEKGKAADALIGLMKLSPLVFGFKDFLSMTGTNRKKLVLKHCNVGDIDKVHFENYIIEKLKELGIDEESFTVIYRPIITAALKNNDDILDGAIKYLETEFKALNDKAKLENYSGQKFAELKADNQSNLSKKTLLEDEVKKFTDIINMTIDQLARYHASMQSKQSDNERAEKLLAEIKMAKFEEFHTEATADKLLDLQQKRDDYMADAEVHKVEMEKLDLDFNNLVKLHNDTVSKINKLEDISMSLSLDKYGQSEKIHEFKTERLCPVTGDVCSGAVEAIENALNLNLDKIQTAIEDNAQAIADAKKRLEILVDEQVKSSQQLIEASEAFRSKYGGNPDTHIYNLNKMIAEHERQLRDKETFEQRKAQRIESLTSEMDRLNAKVYDGLDIDAEATKALAESARESRNNAIAELDQIKEKLMLYNNQVKAHEEYQIASAKLSAVKTLQKIVGPHGYQGDFIFKALDQTTDTIKSIISKLLPGSIFFFNMDGNQFDFGINGVSFESLSGYEQIAVSMAIVIGLTTSKYRLIVIDEINNIHKNNFDGFISCLQEIDNYQFIVAGTVTNTYSIERLIEL